MGTPVPHRPPRGAAGHPTFGALLRRYRLAAGLSQEELAERAGLSVQGLSALENGRRQAPYRHTVGVLAQALGLSAAACALQHALLAEHWPPETPLRVRVGLHTGEAELRGIGYYGLSVNRTARIRSLGHGGQVLLSQATADLVRGTLPEGTSLRALGSHRLKGLAEPEEIYQVLHPGLPADFPPLASPSAHPSNLPVALTSFIGRERERGEVRALLEAARLVTLTGAGGAGKTRLALAVAEALLGEYPDGVWLVELAPLADPALVVQAVATALGLREEPQRPLRETLLAHLTGKRLLLVLDNCEHLVDACATLAEALLRGCAHLRILATSREGLGVPGERTYRVPSLAAPDPDHLPAPEGLGEYAAVALFVARAQERRTDFALSSGNARTVVSICARLDGLPLAIELAAARVGSLPVEAIAARLDDRFRLLTAGPRTAVPRQQTLRAALDWSYDLLNDSEQRLLDRLSVFAGGWTLEAAEAVCGGEGIEAWEVLDLLGGLVSKSLVLLEEAGTEDELGRYRLLETVRQYGWERLAANEEAAAVRDRHLEWCAALAEEAAPQLQGLEQGVWLSRLEREHDNLRAALGWSTREDGNRVRGLRLAGALWRFWSVRGYYSEGRIWLEAALADCGEASPTERALALHGNGYLASVQDDYGRAVSLHEAALALRRAMGDKAGLAASLTGLGNVASGQAEYAQAAALYQESLALYRELGDMRGIAHCLTSLGSVASCQGDYERAVALLEESMALHRELGDISGIARSLGEVGYVALVQGDYARSMSLYEESLVLVRTLKYSSGIAINLHGLGLGAYRQGDYERAATALQESLRISHDLGIRDWAVEVLDNLSWVAVARGTPRLAACLGGAAEALQEASPIVPRWGEWRADHDPSVETMRAALGEEAFAAAWAAGRALPLDEAVALALEDMYGQ